MKISRNILNILKYIDICRRVWNIIEHYGTYGIYTYLTCIYNIYI